MKNSRKQSPDNSISETKNTPALGFDTEEKCTQNRKRKAKLSESKTSQSKPNPEQLDHETEKRKDLDSDKGLGSVQTKSKRGRTIAKVNYTEIFK